MAVAKYIVTLLMSANCKFSHPPPSLDGSYRDGTPGTDDIISYILQRRREARLLLCINSSSCFIFSTIQFLSVIFNHDVFLDVELCFFLKSFAATLWGGGTSQSYT